MPTTHLPFDLRFAAIPANDQPPLEGRPRLGVTPPDAGWMRWRFEWSNADTTINLSYIFRLCNIWFWSVAVAHRLLPVTLVIDQEGVLAELCAEWDDIARDRLRLTLRHIDDAETPREFERHVWFDQREGWLRRLGHVFGKRFDMGFDAQAWHCSSPYWPEAACFLPWGWPGQIAPWTESNWPQEKLKAWFFAMIALALTPYGEGFGCADEDGEKSARLRFMFANLRHEAAVAALRALDMTIPAETEEDKTTRQTLTDLFEETDYPDEIVDVPFVAGETAPLPAVKYRSNQLLLVCANVEQINRPLYSVLHQSASLFPLKAGQWIRDGWMRPGRLLESRDRYWIVDWGAWGFAREGGLLGAWARFSWRWPVTSASDFEAPDTPLFRRWRTFALAEKACGCVICPCCGYPHLEEDGDEILDCPICGWPLFLALHCHFIEPDQPLLSDLSGDPDDRPTLNESRRFFVAHGDAFSPDETTRVRRLRRPDVVELRRQVRAAFDEWLAAERCDLPIPKEPWQLLEWMLKDDDEIVEPGTPPHCPV